MRCRSPVVHHHVTVAFLQVARFFFPSAVSACLLLFRSIVTKGKHTNGTQRELRTDKRKLATGNVRMQSIAVPGSWSS